ncbi:2-dehydropantoate 2-reductase N-terminal domain-containing protein [Bacillus paranthracis]
MKIGVVGPGAIGLLYTFYLQKSNQDVTLFYKGQLSRLTN